MLYDLIRSLMYSVRFVLVPENKSNAVLNVKNTLKNH